MYCVHCLGVRSCPTLAQMARLSCVAEVVVGSLQSWTVGVALTLAVTKVLPSGLKAASLMPSAVKGAPICRFVVISQSRTVPSVLAVASILPSGLNTT